MSTESQYYSYNPEKRNIFIEINQERKNLFKEFIVGLFMVFASHASAIVEVFLRKRFGERYITLAQSIGIFIFGGLLFPWVINYISLYQKLLSGNYSSRSRIQSDPSDPFLSIFLLVFLGMAIYHRLEIKRYGTAYDFKRFSLCDGEIFPFWLNIIGTRIIGIKISYYRVVTVLEPLIPIVIGFILSAIPFTRSVGTLLILCGIIFGIRNFQKAQKGRNWVLDNIDKKISSEMKYDVFIGRKPKKDTKGVYLPIDLPDDEETRKSLYNMVEDSFSNTNELWENDFLDNDDSAGARGGFTKEHNVGGAGNG